MDRIPTRYPYLLYLCFIQWVEPLKALGFYTIDKLKEIEKPGKLANDL